MYPLFTLCKIWLVLLVICCNKVKDGEFVNFFPVMGENLLPHESFFFFFFVCGVILDVVFSVV